MKIILIKKTVAVPKVTADNKCLSIDYNMATHWLTGHQSSEFNYRYVAQ